MVDRVAVEKMLAALGVIFSLLFVGYEIGQNTKVARATAVQGTTDQIIQWQTERVQDPDWIRIITFLYEDGRFADLSPEDQTRYSWTVSATVRIMENRYRQLLLGIIDKEDLGVGGGMSNPAWFRSHHFIDWWRSSDRTRSWSADFLAFFETEVLGIR
jgi:hypothetical protein